MAVAHIQATAIEKNVNVTQWFSNFLTPSEAPHWPRQYSKALHICSGTCAVVLLQKECQYVQIILQIL